LILLDLATSRSVQEARAAASASTLSVVGNHLVDNGSVVVLRGVNRSGAEYACWQGWGFFDGPSDDASIAAIAAWGVNAVRVPFNEDCWLGINGINPAYAGANYQAAISGFVTRLRAHGLYVILSNQVAGPGTTQATTILPMPDADHAPTMWSSVATAFKGDKGVIFDLYNEPHDVSWSCWANGCQVTGGVNFVTQYTAAGMTSLTAAVRSTGATNVILIGGLSWAYDISGWLANRPTDGQLMASIHNYGASGYDTPTIWDSIYAPTALQVPVTIGEMGFDVYVEKMMTWADAHGIGYLAWTWDTWGPPQALVSDYAGTPTTYGLGFKNYLAGLPPPTAPTVTSVAPSSGPTGGGTSVTIMGTNLTGATAVKFGVTAAATFTVNTATQITATSPSGSGTVDVTVTTPSGTSAPGALDHFTFVAGPAVYTALAPQRLLDTRTNHSMIGPGGSVTIGIGGVGSVPANATAVVLNVTAADETTAGFFTVYPTGATLPTASNVNWVAGETVPNLVSVGLGTGGSVTIYNGLGKADAIVDLEGYFAPSSGGTAGEFVPVVPARIADTRAGSGHPNAGLKLTAGSTLNVQVTGAGGIPAAGVTAVVLNTTVTDTTTAGFLTVFPTGTMLPTASNLNWTAGVTVPNRIMVPVGTGGQVAFYNGLGSADLIVDVSGYFTDSSGAGASFTPVTPARIIDTRNGMGPLGAGATMPVQVAGNGGVPSSGASAVVLNVTVVNPTAGSDLVIWPDLAGQPSASDLNFAAGQTVPNLVVVKVSPLGKIDIFNAFGSTNVIVDVVGWYG
jgi:endoglucanase